MHYFPNSPGASGVPCFFTSVVADTSVEAVAAPAMALSPSADVWLDTLAQPSVWCEPAQAPALMHALGKVLYRLPVFAQSPDGRGIGDLAAGSVPGVMKTAGTHGDSFFIGLVHMLNAAGQLDRLLDHHRLPADRPEHMLRGLLIQQLPLLLAPADCEALATAVRLFRMESGPRPDAWPGTRSASQAVPLPAHGAVGLGGNSLPVRRSLGDVMEEDRATLKRRVEAEPPAMDLKRWRGNASSDTPSRSPSPGPAISPSWFLPAASPVRPEQLTSQPTLPEGAASPAYGGRLLTPPPGGRSSGGTGYWATLEQKLHADIDRLWAELSLDTPDRADERRPPPASRPTR